MNTSHRRPTPVAEQSAVEIFCYSVFGDFACTGAIIEAGILTGIATVSEANKAAAAISGNPCKVIAGTRQEIAAIDRNRYRVGTVCYSWPEPNAVQTGVGGAVKPAATDALALNKGPVDSKNTYRLACTNNGVEVQFCGHGLLATAHYWLDRLESSAKVGALEETASSCGIVMLIGDQAIYVRNSDRALRGDSRFLSAYTSSLQLTTTATPSWLQQYYAEEVIDCCAMTTAEDGYLIVEFQAGTDLSALVPYAVNMAPENYRGVIYVALEAADSGPTSNPLASLAPSIAPGADYQPVRQRYFAPQHGNPEDTATGSAARAVASYFSSRYVKLFIHQQSAAGGWLLTEYNSNQIVLTGASQCKGREQ